MQACRQEGMLACMQTYRHKYIHTCIHTCMHTCMHIHTHTCIHTYIHAYMHTHIYIHTCVHSYIYALACMHTYVHHPYIHALALDVNDRGCCLLKRDRWFNLAWESFKSVSKFWPSCWDGVPPIYIYIYIYIYVYILIV
jgi:hypothetical protein